MTTTKNRSGLILLALIVIAAGTLLLIFHAGLLPMAVKLIIFSWQTLLIALGLVLLAQSHRRTSGAILVVIGTVFLLPKIPVPAFKLFHANGPIFYWAIILIVVGVYILFKAMFGKSRHCCHKACSSSSYYQSKSYAKHKVPKNETGYMERSYLFGGGDEVVDTQDFKGGEINCVFGGVELDLSKAQLAEGVHTLEINTVFGGATLFVPPHWKVELRPTSIFGSFEDKRTPSYFNIEENKTLIIVASAVFGGGEIRTK